MSNKKNKNFRLRCKKFFLTYYKLPNLNNLEELALSNFERIFKINRKKFHEDGNLHLYVYLEFSMVRGIYSYGKLSLILNGEKYYGIYKSVKSEHSSVQYIIKTTGDLNKLYKNKYLPIYKGKYFNDISRHLSAVFVNEGKEAALDVLYRNYPKQSNEKEIIYFLNLLDFSKYK